MTKEREALKLALEALEYPINQSHENFNVDMAELLAHRAITAIEEALMSVPDGAQPAVTESHKQEPFAFLHPQKGFYFAKPTKILAPTIVDVEPLALYTTPSLHKPLSDEKLKKIWYDMENIMGWYSFQEIARAIEQAHGIGE